MTGHEYHVVTSTAEFIEIIRHFMGIKRYLKPVIPEEVSQARERFHALLPHAKTWGRHEFDLFYTVGALLVRREETMTMGELSQALDVPLSTATRIVDHLVKHEYAQRLADPDDRRIVRVSLTASGQQLFRGLNEFLKVRTEQILRHLTPEEQATLLGLLRKLLNALNEEIA